MEAEELQGEENVQDDQDNPRHVEGVDDQREDEAVERVAVVNEIDENETDESDVGEYWSDEGGDNENQPQNNLLTDEEAELENAGPARPLFQGIPDNAGMNLRLEYNDEITAVDHLLQTLAMAIRFGHTYENIIAQLELVEGMFRNINIPTTKSQLWKILGRDKTNTVCRLYCTECKQKIASGSKPTVQCRCGRCGPELPETYVATFIQIRLIPQLEELLNLPDMAEALRYKFNRVKISHEAIEDIYDGENYKLLEQEGQFLSHPHNFSLTMWTDGVHLTESSTATAYPVLLQLNELHPYARKKHLLLAGIWVGRGSPAALTAIMLTIIRDINIITTVE